MLMRADPFLELDRLTAQVLGTAARPAAIPMDARRVGCTFEFEFDFPGVAPESINLDVERNVVTVRAERSAVESSKERLASEPPQGVFSHQLILGENLSSGHIEASYDTGVLSLRILVAEKARPRKVAIATGEGNRHAINALPSNGQNWITQTGASNKSRERCRTMPARHVTSR